MRLLTAAAAGLAVCAFCSVLRTESTRRLPWSFTCWLCKRPTASVVRKRTRHCDCSYCGISNKLVPGATKGALPDIDVSLV